MTCGSFRDHLGSSRVAVVAEVRRRHPGRLAFDISKYNVSLSIVVAWL